MRAWHQPCIVIDVDQTLCPLRGPDENYSALEPYHDIVQKVREYKERGWYVIIYTGRQMRTHEGNQGLINATTLPALVTWLNKHNIPFDEIWPNKPWCGFNGVYVDDHTINPSIFLSQSWESIQKIVAIQQYRPFWA